MRRHDVDAVIVGAGHNGLVCAFYLARAGYRVVVLERADCVGGAAITEEFHPGFRNSVASYTVSLLAPKIIADMKLSAHGLRIVPRPVANFVPGLDGPGLQLYSDPQRTRMSIAAFSSGDADRYAAFSAELDGITDIVRGLLLEAPIDPLGGWREWLRALQRIPRLRSLLSRPGLAPALWSLMTGSAGHWLDRWFETDPLKGALGFDAVVGHYASPYMPGSGYLLLHHALGEVDGVRGAWGHAIGGMGAVTVAMASAARAAGVEIRLNESVESIAQEASGVVVQTAAGDHFHARVAGAAVHPRILFGRLIEPGELPEAFAARLKAWRSESASFRMNVALAELPRFSCEPGVGAQPYHGAGILISMSLGYLDKAYLDARTNGYSRAPVVELLIPSTLDATLAPRGAHVASLFCQHFPRNLDWTAKKAEVIATIISTVTDHAPNFRQAIVGLQALSPEDLETRFGLLGGDIFHGQMTLDQLYWSRPAMGYSGYRSPLARVYLCASGAHPGGGVSGAPGHNAAQAMLRDLETLHGRRA